MSGCAAARNFVAVLSAKMQTPLTPCRTFDYVAYVLLITIPVEEGQRYRLKDITFTGNKAVKNTQALRSLFKIKDGDVFDTEAIRKGLESLRKAYAALGYINFTPVPNTDADDEKRTISLRIDVDEGKQFYVRRIEFQGNTTTRDKVIRRELRWKKARFITATCGS